MSFLTDLVEGHTDKLGTDISHAGSSFANHPMEWAEVGGAAALGAAPFLLPELGGALGAGGAAEGGGLFSGFGGLFGGGADAAAAGGTDALALTADAGSGIAESPAIQAINSAAGAVDSSAINPATGASALSGENPLLGSISADPITGVGTGVAPGIGGPAAAPPPGGFMNSLSPSNWTLGGVGKVAGVAAAGAGLGMNLMHGNQVDPNQQKLADMAQQLGSQGQVLESYLKTGKLPPALQASLDQAKSAAKARLISGYAQRGQSTDPRMNSALAQELNNLDLQAVADMAKVQVDMLNTGLKETGMSMELYTMLTQMDEKQNQDLMKSIQNMAMALGGGFGGSKAA